MRHRLLRNFQAQSERVTTDQVIARLVDVGAGAEVGDVTWQADARRRRSSIPCCSAQIGDLALLARTVVDGFLHGLHRSLRPGLSLDFAEHRPYQPGDDLRRIDWRVYGRTDRFYLKTYEADTNADVVFALDASASMDFGSDRGHQVRLRPHAGRVAALAGAAPGRPGRPGHDGRRPRRHRAALDPAPRSRSAHAGTRRSAGAGPDPGDAREGRAAARAVRGSPW